MIIYIMTDNFITARVMKTNETGYTRSLRRISWNLVRLCAEIWGNWRGTIQ